MTDKTRTSPRRTEPVPLLSTANVLRVHVFHNSANDTAAVYYYGPSQTRHLDSDQRSPAFYNVIIVKSNMVVPELFAMCPIRSHCSCGQTRYND